MQPSARYGVEVSATGCIRGRVYSIIFFFDGFNFVDEERSPKRYKKNRKMCTHCTENCGSPIVFRVRFLSYCNVWENSKFSITSRMACASSFPRGVDTEQQELLCVEIGKGDLEF